MRTKGWIAVRIGGVPELNYDGPSGCPGRYFTSGDESSDDFYFRYGATGALLLRGNTLYRCVRTLSRPRPCP